MEVKNTIKKVYYFDIETLTEKVLTNKECDFKYRDSIFKNKFKNKFIITKVVFCLNKEHANNSNYGAINEGLNKLKMEPSLKSIFKAVINIRNQKLPDPKKLGNSGSFFKNPIIENKKFQKLNEKDLVVMCDVGAYGMSLSSNYNVRPKPPELIIKGSKINIIKKRQKLKDLI